jgi:putative redox protein
MGETVVVWQNSAFETLFWAADPHVLGSEALFPVTDLNRITPYGMLLAGLGGCTAIVMHTYAQAHSLLLDEVELRLTYERTFAEDCENCEQQPPYEESIEQQIIVRGDLTAGERKRLKTAAGYCPIHKILKAGVEVVTTMLDAETAFVP